jgi:biopolymer transport protein ExbD
VSSHKKSFKVKKKSSAEMALQITSMADIFTIILVFLLKSFTSGAVNITPSQGVKLPAAKSEATQIQALTVEVSSDAVQVDHSLAAPLTNFHFPAGAMGANGVPPELDKVFDLQRKKQDLISKANADVKANGKIVVVADERVPYVTVKAVLASAAIHGFSEFKLVVVQKD